MIFIIVLITTPVSLFAQHTTAVLPNNSHEKTYSKSWKRNQGFRKSNESCIAIKIPDNAYPTNTLYGTGWECSRGYKAIEKSCVAISIPQNAFLNSNRGNRWKCERGHKKVSEICNECIQR